MWQNRLASEVERGTLAELIAASTELRGKVPSIGTVPTADVLFEDNETLEQIDSNQRWHTGRCGRSQEEADEIYHGGM